MLDTLEDGKPNLGSDVLLALLPVIASFESKRRSERVRVAIREVKERRWRTRSGRPPGWPVRATPEKVSAIALYRCHPPERVDGDERGRWNAEDRAGEILYVLRIDGPGRRTLRGEGCSPSFSLSAIAPAGGGLGGSFSPGGAQTIRFPTVYCKTCQEINVACETRPLEGGVSLKGIHVTILLPRNLQILLRTRGPRQRGAGSVLADVFRGAHGALRRFIKTGTNPCREHHMGFPVRVKVRGGLVAL